MPIARSAIRPSKCFGSRRPPRGFTLIEVLIATLLLVTALVGSIGLVVALKQVNLSSRSRDTAYYLAQQALDTLEAVPLALPLPTTGFLAPGAAASTPTNTDGPLLGNMLTPTTMTCYPMSDDTITDRPISCQSPMAPAYVVRTWTCCDFVPNNPAATIGTIAGMPALTINSACGPDAAIGTLGSPDTLSGNGVACLIQAEVTWPVELAGPPATSLSAAPSQLFVDTSLAAPVLNFSNHVYLSAVRSL
jgi:type II secretory pathway pseudopilin PulG